MRVNVMLWPSKVLVAAFGVLVVALGQHAPLHVEFRPLGDIVTGHNFDFVPRWSGRALISIENGYSALPIVRLFNEHGDPGPIISVRIPGADYLEIYRAAQAPNGEVAVCGTSKDSDGRIAGFFAVANIQGMIARVVRTEPFVPAAITFAPDGTIWTKGAEFDRAHNRPASTEAGVLRRYDVRGNLLAQYLPQSNLTRSELFLGVDQLSANAQRVGWYQGTGAKSYFEVADSRVERHPIIDGGQTDGHLMLSGLTITHRDQAFITRSINGENPQLFMLDRSANRWIEIAVPTGGEPPATAWLLGGSENVLVFKTTEQSRRLRRFEVNLK